MAGSTAAPRPDRIGPYEILDALGSGGMGVVYRARDPRLSREVAVKVIHHTSEGDPRWRQRFADEARAAAALNHPNILAVHDVGIDVESPYIVSELIDGVSLREELKRGTMRLSRVIDLAAQIADGLSAAHRTGLIHRDFKPENVMVTRDGRAKIVDFGLAKAVGPAGDAGNTRTITAPHTVLGTPAYMSPEQARGEPVDFRSDQFSFGAVLYEMITGRLAFDRPSSIDTLSAILHDEPRPLGEVAQNVPTDLQRIVDRCLAKPADDRYGATADLLRDLQWLKSHPPSGPIPAGTAEPRRASRRALMALAPVVLAAATFAAGWWTGSATTPGAASEVGQPKWQRLTFEQGYVHQARFGPDGQTVVYAASWNGQPLRLYSTTTLSPESRAVDLPPAGLLAISRSGQLAVSMNCVYDPASAGCVGTLGQAPLLGGAPRGLAENVRWADWGPDGLAAIVAGRLEYPVGTPLAGRADHVRVSPDGRRLAYSVPRDSEFAIVVRDGARERVIVDRLRFSGGLAWAPDGDALYWSGASADIWDDGIVRTAMDGASRVVLRSGPRLRILDVDARNRLLVDRSESDTRAWITDRNGSSPREISWLGSSVVDAMSPDGKTVLITVRGGPTLTGGRETSLYPIYVRPTDGGAATFLGNGYGLAFSPDGQWALTITRDGVNSSFVLYPLRLGSPRTLDRNGVTLNLPESASFAGPSRIVFDAEAGTEFHTFVQSVDGGPPQRLAHEPGRVVSPVAVDGEHFISQRGDGSLWLATVTAGASIALPWKLQPLQLIRQWSADGRALFVVTLRDDRWIVTRVDVRTGQVTPHAEIIRNPLANRQFRGSLRIAHDGQTIAYSYTTQLSDLYLIDGIR